VLIDYRLLGMTDLKILKAIRESNEDVALIVLFDLKDEKMIVDCLREGADDYVIRTSEYLAVLPVVIHQALQKKELVKREHILHRELTKQNKLSSLGKLILGIGHNMNSPLAGIMGRAQLCMEREERERRELLARKDTMPEEEFEKQLKRYEKNLRDLSSINEATVRLSLLIKNMTYKGNQEQNEAVQYLNLNDLLREELSFLEANMYFKHEVTKHYKFAESLPHIKGVYSDFSQSLMTIVQKALDDMRSAQKKELTVSTSSNSSSISVKIHYTGCSMSEEGTSGVGESSLTPQAIDTSPETGQSLNRALELLKPYGTHISFASQLGETTFTIEIPYNQGKP
jgi:nitrogen-specific signal transduction histidine kinase